MNVTDSLDITIKTKVMTKHKREKEKVKIFRKISFVKLETVKRDNKRKTRTKRKERNVD